MSTDISMSKAILRLNLIFIFFITVSYSSLAQYYSIRDSMWNYCAYHYGIVPISDSFAVIKSFNCIDFINPVLRDTGRYAGEKMTLFDLKKGKKVYSDSFSYYGNAASTSLLYKLEDGYLSVGSRGLGATDSLSILVYNSSLHLKIDKKYLPLDTTVTSMNFRDAVASNKRIYALGWTYHAKGTGPQRQDFYILKTDYFGNKIKDKTIGQNLDYYLPNRIIALSNGNILFTGERRTSQTVNFYYAKELTYAIFYELDTNLNIIRHWESTDDATFGARGLVEVSDGYITSSLYRSERYGTDSSSRYIVKLQKINKVTFDTIWSINLLQNGNNGFLSVNQLIKTLDGNFIAIGESIKNYYDHKDSFLYNKSMGFMIKFTSSGNILWFRENQNVSVYDYGAYLSHNILNDIIELSNHDLVAVGYTQYGYMKEYDTQAWILKVDSFGCLIPGCERSTTAINEAGAQQIHWLVAPNPVKQDLHLYYGGEDKSMSIAITDMAGRALYTILQLHTNTTYTMSTDRMAAGLYLVALMRDGSVVEVKKIVKE